MKRNRLCEKFHIDNKGMSLVEMIVAIAILSVAVAPILYAFVYTTNFNAKAKKRQRATNAAMSVMETFKSYEMTKAHEIFTTTGMQFLDYNTGAEYSFTPDPAEAETDPDTLAGTYKITNMSFSSDDEDTHKYDVEIVAKKGRDEMITCTPLYDPHQDVIFAEEIKHLKTDDTGREYYTYDNNLFDPYWVAERIIGSLDQTKLDYFEIWRDIYLSVSSDGIQVDYKYKYCYQLDGIRKPEDKNKYLEFVSTTDPPATTDLSQTIPVRSFEEEDEEVKNGERNAGDTLPLRDVYFYYYPAYADTYTPPGVDYAVKIKEDSIHFANNYQETNIYIVKQKNNGKTYADLKASEVLYHLEPYYTPELLADVNVFDIVNMNLANEEATKPEFFGSLHNGEILNGGTIKLFHGLDDADFTTDKTQLYMNLTITVKENADAKKDPKEVLAVIKGTVLE